MHARDGGVVVWQVLVTDNPHDRSTCTVRGRGDDPFDTLTNKVKYMCMII